MYSFVVDLLSKTICSGVSVFCLFWLGESRFIRNAVQTPTWNRTHVTSNTNPAVSFRCCCTVFVLFTRH